MRLVPNIPSAYEIVKAYVQLHARPERSGRGMYIFNDRHVNVRSFKVWNMDTAHLPNIVMYLQQRGYNAYLSPNGCRIHVRHDPN
jgi:hypothetical protein